MIWRAHVRQLVLLPALLAGSLASAQPPQLFMSGSHAQILAAHKDRPLILAFWSLSCSHCEGELALLAEVARANPQAALVLVSTDSPAEAPGIEEALRARRLDHVASWVFSDEAPERLRFEVDRRWRGELPRTYLTAPGMTMHAVSGQIRKDELETWLRSALIRR